MDPASISKFLTTDYSKSFSFSSDCGSANCIPIGDQFYHIGFAYYQWNAALNKLVFVKNVPTKTNNLVFFSFDDNGMRTELCVNNIATVKINGKAAKIKDNHLEW